MPGCPQMRTRGVAGVTRTAMDRDTACAIAGGIVVLSAGSDSTPPDWLTAREALPAWPFADAG